MSKVTVSELCATVDALGAINAQIAALTAQANAFKKTLKASGYDEVKGDTFRAVITTKTSARLDTAAVRGLLTPAEIDACTVESTSTSISLFDL